MASKRVPKKASMLDLILKLFLLILEAPERQNGFQNHFKNSLGFKARSSHRKLPGAHFDPLGPRFWSLRDLIFEASAASSAAWPEARSPHVCVILGANFKA